MNIYLCTTVGFYCIEKEYFNILYFAKENMIGNLRVTKEHSKPKKISNREKK